MRRRWAPLAALLAAGLTLALALGLATAAAETREPPAPAPEAAPEAAPAAGAPAAVPAAAAPPVPVSQRLADLNPEAGLRGWKLFFQKKCIACHAVWGEGGTIGPDLGRARLGSLSEGGLAAALWNHIPRMWTKMEEEQIRFESLTRQEMDDIFAFLFYVWHVDEPGDPRRGRLVMLQKGCQTCHAVSGAGSRVGPDLARWARHTNPVVWTQLMWRAAPKMRAAMEERGLSWPVFAQGDVADMLAYLRSVSPSRDKVYLELASPREGARLFAERGCTACHAADGAAGGAPSAAGDPGGAPALADMVVPGNLAEGAGAIWNHAPAMLERMKETGLEPVAIEAKEMADIVAFLLSRRYLDRPGDPARGQAVFEAKGCRRCHEHGTESAPALAAMEADGTASYITHVMWNRGREMLREMAAAGLEWPDFEREELLDLLAYLRQQAAHE